MSQVIALVDDDRNILTSVSIALQTEGFLTRVYSDGESALKALVENPPDLAAAAIRALPPHFRCRGTDKPDWRRGQSGLRAPSAPAPCLCAGEPLANPAAPSTGRDRQGTADEPSDRAGR